MPKRIQRHRTKGWRMPPNTRYVGRPSTLSNHFVVGHRYLWLSSAAPLEYPIPTCRDVGDYDHGLRVEICADAATAVAWYRAWLGTWDPEMLTKLLAPLRGKDLACWCALDQPCHADVLLEIAAGGTP